MTTELTTPQPATDQDSPAITPSLLGEQMSAAPTYEAFKLPDGVSLDDKALSEATQLFQQARLDQAMAQKFVDLAMGREQAAAHRGVQAFADLQSEWTGKIKADPEIGGNKLAASLSAAARAIDRLGVLGLREALNMTGAGNHPAVVKAFVRLGQMLAEDRFQPGRDAAPPAPRSPADVIYDGMPRR
ncbi:MAG TPA: hypothetical protein VFB13_02030 [Reyranella sp.]|jgi:hypothetical protein|nr:hypothetical protein [Reyranella sp.]